MFKEIKVKLLTMTAPVNELLNVPGAMRSFPLHVITTVLLSPDGI